MNEADQHHIEELIAVKYLSFMTFRYKQGIIINFKFQSRSYLMCCPVLIHLIIVDKKHHGPRVAFICYLFDNNTTRCTNRCVVDLTP